MKSDQLLIVFVKNILLGKVKTRLAKSIGDFGAFEVYKELVAITEMETGRLTDCDVHIYFSDVIIESKWEQNQKYVQEGDNLGERMKNAFQNSFDAGYKKVICIGSDLPDLNADIMTEGFEALNDFDTVIGPANDGGYYLLGLKTMNTAIFENKSWSQKSLLIETLADIESQELSCGLLTELNDIDTIEDLIGSSVAEKFKEYYELS